MTLSRITLKRGREKSVKNRHPWLFSGAIQRVQGQPEVGELVDVYDKQNNFLARGAYNPRSQIRIRLLSWQVDQQIDSDFWHGRLERAIAGRQTLINQTDTNAYRLVHSDGDGLPGLIVDQYDEWLVVQFLSAAVEVHKETIVESLQQLLTPRGIYERSDTEARKKEALPQTQGLLVGEEPPEQITIAEHGQSFLVDVRQGHKTGFYLDQRENRRKVAKYAAGKRVLNAFSYTGGFAVSAGHAGASHITNLDSSAAVLELARQNVSLNQPERDDTYEVADVFQQLRHYQQTEQTFDLIILDPPKFVHNRSQIEKGARGYKDINMWAMKILESGGVLASFSCSGQVSADLFQKILFGAAVDAGREVQIIERLTQGSDHPISLTCPESDYLKGLVCRVW
ncbi:class I SAM-dependent rRNA methyltransferase [Anaerolineales bacterium HSG25]|nr:class I SAM-dependent rRNA methyltransferase [Anaerolineales bacterium HSG25]